MERHLNEELAAAARAMADQRGTSDTLDRALRAAIDIIDGCELAGFSVVTRTGIETLAATSDALRKIDHLQHDLEQGPCRDALRRHEFVTPVLKRTDAGDWIPVNPKLARHFASA